jgi:hypothetical protein
MTQYDNGKHGKESVEYHSAPTVEAFTVLFNADMVVGDFKLPAKRRTDPWQSGFGFDQISDHQQNYGA